MINYMQNLPRSIIDILLFVPLMYVVQFECLPNDNIPDEHLKSHKYWLINNDDRTRMPITLKAIEFHKLDVTNDNKNIDIHWDQSRIFNIFVFDLLPGVCEAPIPSESRTPRSSLAVNELDDISTSHISEVTVVVHEEALKSAILPMTTTSYITEMHKTAVVPVCMTLFEDSTTDYNGSDVLPVTPASDSQMPVARHDVTNNIVNNGIKDIYSNDTIQDKFVIIYESLGKVKGNASLVLDIIQEFSSMKTKGINVGAALPDLEMQHGELMAFEKEALDEIIKINMLNKMIQEQINALESKCMKKALEIEENS